MIFRTVEFRMTEDGNYTASLSDLNLYTHPRSFVLSDGNQSSKFVLRSTRLKKDDEFVAVSYRYAEVSYVVFGFSILITNN